jgi:hypothetical protein
VPLLECACQRAAKEKNRIGEQLNDLVKHSVKDCYYKTMRIAHKTMQMDYKTRADDQFNVLAFIHNEENINIRLIMH